MRRFAGILFLIVCLASCGGGLSLSVAPLSIASASVSNATVGTPSSFSFTATGGTAPYTWSVQSGRLPAGFTLTSTGTLSGTPTMAGTASFVVEVTDAPSQSATKAVTLVISPARLAIATKNLPPATSNAAYSAALSASGGTAPYSWTVKAGTLPAGLTLSSSGTISGTPSAGAGANGLTFEVTDSGAPAQTASTSLSLTVSVANLAVTTATVGAASVNATYSAALTASGGQGSYAWSLQSGVLPPGLSLSAAGVLSGTPTTAGITTFVATVVDQSSPPQSASQTLSVVVAAAGATLKVALSPPSAIVIGGSFAGLSYEKNTLSTALFSPGDSSLIALFNRLGSSLLRIGGDSVDKTLWSAAGPGETTYQVSPPDVDRLAAFLRSCNWKVLYGIEFLNERATPVTVTDPALVAQEAVYAMQSLGDSLYGFELGNEPDVYGDKIPGYDYAMFQAQWDVYRDAILAAVAAAKAAGTLPQSATPRFTGPAAAYDQTGFVAPFAAGEAANISLLTRHYYRANGEDPSSTMALLLAPDPALTPDLQAMEASASSNNIAAGYRIAEANSFYNGGAPGISDGFGTALWAINFLFSNAWQHSAGVNFHGGGDSTGYTPIADDKLAAVEVRPEYYGIYLFSKAANGNLIATTTTPALSSLYAYAVAAGSATNVMLVNTDATTSVNVQIDFNAAVSSAQFVTLTGPSLGSTTGQLMNGAAIAADGSWPALTAPPLLIQSNSIQVPVAGGSALLLIVQ